MPKQRNFAGKCFVFKLLLHKVILLRVSTDKNPIKIGDVLPFLLLKILFLSRHEQVCPSVFDTLCLRYSIKNIGPLVYCPLNAKSNLNTLYNVKQCEYNKTAGKRR